MKVVILALCNLHYVIRNHILILKKYGNPFIFFFYIKYFKLRNYAAKILKKRDEVVYNLFKEAIFDGSKGNLGVKYHICLMLGLI